MSLAARYISWVPKVLVVSVVAACLISVADLVAEGKPRGIEMPECIALCKRLSAPYYETSAKTGYMQCCELG